MFFPSFFVPAQAEVHGAVDVPVLDAVVRGQEIAIVLRGDATDAALVWEG